MLVTAFSSIVFRYNNVAKLYNETQSLRNKHNPKSYGVVSSSSIDVDAPERRAGKTTVMVNDNDEDRDAVRAQLRKAQVNRFNEITSDPKHFAASQSKTKNDRKPKAKGSKKEKLKALREVKQAKRDAASDHLALITAQLDAASDQPNIKSSNRLSWKPRKHFHYHDYAIIIVHYHKTGYVLSRELKNLVREIELQATKPDEDNKEWYNPVKFELPGIDEETGERFAFDQVGSWVRITYQVLFVQTVTSFYIFINENHI